MATVTDVNVANDTFPNVRSDLNDILEALATNFSADAEPTTTYANQFWYETDTNLLKIRNEANDAWISIARIDQTNSRVEIIAESIEAADSNGLLIKNDGATVIAVEDDGDVAIDTDTLFVDAGNDRIGVGTTTPAVTLDLTSNTDAVAMPSGTTAQRPTGVNGQIRYNSSDNAFEGYANGSWGEIGGGGGATGGGSDQVFYENGQTVTTSYTLTTNTNAMTVGTISIDSGVTVTVPTGSRWVVI